MRLGTKQKRGFALMDKTRLHDVGVQGGKRAHKMGVANEFKKGNVPWNKDLIKFISENHHNWKGNDVGYHGLHAWVNRRLVRPNKCPNCGKEGKIELANISQEYKRDLTDWEWLCTRCHMTKDGRLKAFYQYRPRTSVKQYDKNIKFIAKYKSILEAKRRTGISNTSISNVLAGRAYTAGGYIWKRV